MVQVILYALVITAIEALLLAVLIQSLNSSAAKNRKTLRSEEPPEAPLSRGKLHDEMRRAMEPMLLAWRDADETKLPARMDKTFKQHAVHSVALLRERHLRRELRFTDIQVHTTDKRYNFAYWNDFGREWREGIVYAAVLERYLTEDGSVLSEQFYPRARLIVTQSRHIHFNDQKKQKPQPGKKQTDETLYADSREQICPSCGGTVTVDTQEVTCPFCGRVFVSVFHDWQTESFIFEEYKRSKDFTAFIPFLLLVLFCNAAFLLPYREDTISPLFALFLCVLGTLFAGVLYVIYAVIAGKLRGLRTRSIVRYSESLLRGCLYEALWAEADRSSVLDLWIGKVSVRSVRHTEDTTAIRLSFPVFTRSIGDNNAITLRRAHHADTYVRARYPERLRAKGEIVQDKECPSCGGAFIPDEKGCCKACGFSLHIDNAKWKRSCESAVSS